ncbi:MAG: hypothetical protein H7066_20550 [Cytophagaceae bacterium]|nr:hypothetical protein [Gemmatimonadaceae bacterium]
MRPRSVLLLLLASTVDAGCASRAPSSAGALATTATAGPTIALVNGQWYTGSGFARRTLYMIGGVLLTRRPSRVDSTIDLANGYVIPPFGDAHTHNLDGTFNLDKVRGAYVAEGTFYVQVLTNAATNAAQVRDRWNRACDLDVLYANGGITSTLSHPFLAYEPRAMGLYGEWAPHAAAIRTSRLREGNAYWFIDDLAALDATWPRILAARPGVLKIFLLDAMEQPPAMPDSGLPHGHGLRPSLVPEIVRRAHAANLRVAAHVETAADFAIAVDAGVDIMAHLPGYGFGNDPDGRARLGGSTAAFEIPETVARKAGQRRIVVTPTVSWTLGGSGPDSAAAVVVRQALMKRNIDRLTSAGVRFVVGSDWFGSTATHEITDMRAARVWDDATLLHMWAVETPQSIFPGRKIARFDDGYEASFLVLDQNPVSDFNAVKSIRLRVKQGCPVS